MPKRLSFVSELLIDNHPNMSELQRFTSYKKYAIDAATDLCYSRDTLQALRSAESVGEITRIMNSARNTEL